MSTVSVRARAVSPATRKRRIIGWSRSDRERRTTVEQTYCPANRPGMALRCRLRPVDDGRSRKRTIRQVQTLLASFFGAMRRGGTKMPFSATLGRWSHRLMKPPRLRVESDEAEREQLQPRPPDRRSLKDRRRFTRRERRGSRDLKAVASDEPMAIAGRKHAGDT